ncbi:MAG: hypothetical protein IGS38_18690 [Synechococcales cyanobacterium M58_A2018_015]|nr:hypothetical protein [Synechococcales cyanobacterium M58_A2018_015]
MSQLKQLPFRGLPAELVHRLGTSWQQDLLMALHLALSHLPSSPRGLGETICSTAASDLHIQREHYFLHYSLTDGQKPEATVVLM